LLNNQQNAISRTKQNITPVRSAEKSCEVTSPINVPRWLRPRVNLTFCVTFAKRRVTGDVIRTNELALVRISGKEY